MRSLRPRRARTLNGLIVSALSVALLAIAAGSASAATISPPSKDFGIVLLGKVSAPVTFTVTKGSETEFPIRQIPDIGGFVTNNNSLGFWDTGVGTCGGLDELTATTPSCTINVAYQVDGTNELGRNRGVVVPNFYSQEAIAQLTATGRYFNPAKCKKLKTKRARKKCRRQALRWG